MSDAPPAPADTRPEQPAPSEPHWIVLRLTKDSLRPLHQNRAYFRHRSAEAAATEAQRLAERHPGYRFAVYAQCGSFKVHAPAEPHAEPQPDASE